MDVHLVAPLGSLRDEVARRGFTPHLLEMARDGTNPLRELDVVRQIASIYRRVRPDVVHHFALKSVLHGTLAARLVRVPAIVGSITGLGYTFIPGGMRRTVLREVVSGALRAALFRARAHTIFQNEDDLSFFISRKIVRREETSLVLGSGVDTDAFRPGSEPDGAFTVVTGTRMLWDKGLGELVAAASVVRERGHQLRLIFAGTPDPRNPASIPEENLKKWHDEGVIEWLGHVADMPAVLGRGHAACLPSYREGLPLFLAEAAASGKPIITTDVPGCRAVVVDGQTGFLVKVRDSLSLADALTRLAADAELRRRMGESARQHAVSDFSRQRIIRDIFGVYANRLSAAGIRHDWVARLRTPATA